MRASDRLMALASALLKYQFIHQTAKISWSDVQVSRTPKPHGRPYWDPPTGWTDGQCKGLEFNVSHQAGLVVLVGCKVPTRPDHAIVTGIDIRPGTGIAPKPIRIGVDIACPTEKGRSPDLSTQAKLVDWIDMFGEMFSARERTDMKDDPIPVGGDGEVETDGWNWEGEVLKQKARRFYTYWALKEAYIKMVGEGLLANWLTKLEFTNVLPPSSGERSTANDSGMQALFYGTDITEAMQIELEVLQDIFILATITRGIKEEEEEGHDNSWQRIDLDGDIRKCAEGLCSCLN